jgi:hypothetical protein
MAIVAILLLSPIASASPITYSTTGNVDIPNEPDKTLVGATGQSIDGVNSFPSTIGTVWNLGFVNILPLSGTPSPDGSPDNPIPDYKHTSADITIAFSDASTPTLNIKAAFGPYTANGINFANTATVNSITSSNPALDANLPPLFAGMLHNPGATTLQIGMWDWGITSVPLYLTYQPVPEPSTITVFITLAAGLGISRLRHSLARNVRS